MTFDRKHREEDPTVVTPQDMLELNGRVWALMRTVKAMLELAPDASYRDAVRARMNEELGSHFHFEHWHPYERPAIDETLSIVVGVPLASNDPT